MKILSVSLLLSALFLVLGSQPPVAHGCAAASRKGESVRIASETALIVWDEKSKTQHFIRRASFETREPYFGFLVPTPTKPTLAETPDEVFQRLEEWTKPEERTETDYQSFIPIGLPSSGEPKDFSVEVVESGRVANFNYVVLKANDRQKLRGWLDENGYDARPRLTDWLEVYIKQGWYLTAFRIAKQDSGHDEASMKAIRMSFTTDGPFFPYREPAADAGTKSPRRRLLRVFVVSGQRMQGVLGAGKAVWAKRGNMPGMVFEAEKTPWPGEAVWANPLQAEQHEAMTMLLDRRQVPLNKGAWLTVFDDGSSPRPGSDDLFFYASDDQSTLQREPIIHYQIVYRPGPVDLCCLFTIATPIILLLLARRFRRRGKAG
jgi:hypothetical protein